MHVATRAQDLPENQTGNRVLVPTMGALHEGHMALIRQARKTAGFSGEVAVSIFVNPIQFDRSSDLNAYPRQLELDLKACENEGADLVFTPDPGGMYHPDRSVMVTENSLGRTLCGASRPGHFDGVCTVVLKLFNLLRPNAAVFGEKDFQQLAIIRRMVRDLDVPVEIIAGKTVREADGLAMSSRNVRLSAEQRSDAVRIHQALSDARVAAEMPHADSADILKRAWEQIQSPLNQIDYLELVDAETLQSARDFNRPSVLATAVFYGDVRLIDNMPMPHKPSS